MTSALKINESVFELNTKVSAAQNLSELAQQAAHDIKSPLSALNILTRTGHAQMSEEARDLMLAAIQRINDIANDLLKLQSVADSCTAINSEKNVQPVNLVAIAKEIIQEKNLKFRDAGKNIIVDADFDETLMAISEINKCDLQRVISNLVENAAEAIEHTHGKVTVSINCDKDFVNLQIRDNGKGIPQHILSKIGTRGFSYGKHKGDSGCGLGVYHAKSVIASYGGELKIASMALIGTVILIKLPRRFA